MAVLLVPGKQKVKKFVFTQNHEFLVVLTEDNTLATYKVSEFFFKALREAEFEGRPIIDSDLRLVDVTGDQGDVSINQNISNLNAVSGIVHDVSAEPQSMMVLDDKTHEENFLPNQMN